MQNMNYRHESTGPLLWEIGVDEAGRGPLLGRLYAAAVVLPREPRADADYSYIRDSKRFSSRAALRAAAAQVRAQAVVWSVQFVEAEEVDRINIRQAVLQAMRAAIVECQDQCQGQGQGQCLALVDGNDSPDPEGRLASVLTVVGGDNRYASIAAASILAKDARDEYVLGLCALRPELAERYSLHTNFGYPTRAHLQGIATWGLCDLHRRSYRPCRDHTATAAAGAKSC